MKQLIRRLARVADSSATYELLSPRAARRRSASAGVPMYVGEEMERFVVSADLLSHPIFVKLLKKSAQEYGYEQPGVLRIPCDVLVFERLLEAVRVGADVAASDSLVEQLS